MEFLDRANNVVMGLAPGRTPIHADFPGTLLYRDLALRLITSAAKLVEHSDSQFRDELVSAFGEAFNNVAMHSYRDRSDGRVDLVIEFGSDWLRIDLTDTGRSFDPTTVTSPDLNLLPESGMGLFIIRSFVDELSYQPGPPNRLSMTKRVKAVAAGAKGAAYG